MREVLDCVLDYIAESINVLCIVFLVAFVIALVIVLIGILSFAIIVNAGVDVFIIFLIAFVGLYARANLRPR